MSDSFRNTRQLLYFHRDLDGPGQSNSDQIPRAFDGVSFTCERLRAFPCSRRCIRWNLIEKECQVCRAMLQ